MNGKNNWMQDVEVLKAAMEVGYPAKLRNLIHTVVKIIDMRYSAGIADVNQIAEKIHDNVKAKSWQAETKESEFSRVEPDPHYDTLIIARFPVPKERFDSLAILKQTIPLYENELLPLTPKGYLLKVDDITEFYPGWLCDMRAQYHNQFEMFLFYKESESC